MKSKVIVSAIAAAAMSFGSLSYAQTWDRDGRGDRDGRTYDRTGQYQQRQYDRQGQQQYSQPRQYSRQGQYNNYQGQYNNYQGQRSQWNGHASHYYRGDHLPNQFRQHQYYVNDWRASQLYAPPYGHQWVRSDSGDFLLIALTTGLIANLLINH